MSNRGVNKVILIGHVGGDPKNASLQNGSAVSNFSLATSEEWKDKNTGEKQTRTEWHRVSVFGKLAEITASYVKKGSHLYVEGQLRTRQYVKDGVKMHVTEVIADQFRFLGSSTGGGVGQQSSGVDVSHQMPPVDAPPDDDIPF